MFMENVDDAWVETILEQPAGPFKITCQWEESQSDELQASISDGSADHHMSNEEPVIVAQLTHKFLRY